MPRLDVTGTAGFARTFVLRENDAITVGRAPENTLTEGGHGLSRKHASIVYCEGLAILRDLNSSNGTLLNGEEIKRPQVLESGHVVTCGELQIVFYAD